MASADVSQGLPGTSNGFFSQFNNILGTANTAISGIAGVVNSTAPLWGNSPPPTPNANPQPTYQGDGRATSNNVTNVSTVTDKGGMVALGIGAVLLAVLLWS